MKLPKAREHPHGRPALSQPIIYPNNLVLQYPCPHGYVDTSHKHAWVLIIRSPSLLYYFTMFTLKPAGCWTLASSTASTRTKRYVLAVVHLYSFLS